MELKVDLPLDPYWNEYMARNSLASWSSRFSIPGYTYFLESLGQKKLIAHFISSKSLLNDDRTGNFCILDEGSNLSDHLPIIMNLYASTKKIGTNFDLKFCWHRRSVQ